MYGQSHFPNFDFMTAGYDVMIGNPNSYLGVDPGYSGVIFEKIYNDTSNKVNNYVVPMVLKHRIQFQCKYRNV